MLGKQLRPVGEKEKSWWPFVFFFVFFALNFWLSLTYTLQQAETPVLLKILDPPLQVDSQFIIRNI